MTWILNLKRTINRICLNLFVPCVIESFSIFFPWPPARTLPTAQDRVLLAPEGGSICRIARRSDIVCAETLIIFHYYVIYDNKWRHHQVLRLVINGTPAPNSAIPIRASNRQSAMPSSVTVSIKLMSHVSVVSPAPLHFKTGR